MFPPEAGVIDVAAVVPVGPPPTLAAFSVTVTLAGGIVPMGNPDPVTLTDPTKA